MDGVGFVGTGGTRGRVSQAVLRFAVAALSALLVVVLVGLVVVELQPSWLAGLRNAVPAAPPARVLLPGRSPPSPLSPSAHGAGASTPASLAGGPGAPVLSAIRPASGRAGATVTLTGANLFSPNGNVLVSFGGTPAQTRCPTEQRCTATVPKPAPGTRSTSVRVRTAGGLSNALVFSFR